MRIKFQNASNYLFVFPLLFLMAGLIAYPILSAVWLSFTAKQLGRPNVFIGLRNYYVLLGSEEFWRVFRNSFIYAFFAVVLIKLLCGTIIALALNSEIRARNIFRGLFLLPWIIPTAISTLVWQWMLSDIGGVINWFVVQLGLSERPIAFLGDPKLALLSVICVNGWRGIPFVGLIILAALQVIPTEQYEAASIDGASTFQKFCYITFPGIRNVIILVGLLSFIWTLSDFQIVWVLTRGGPGYSTHVFSTYTYFLGFVALDLGKGIAVSLVSFPILLILIILTVKVIARQE